MSGCGTSIGLQLRVGVALVYDFRCGISIGPQLRVGVVIVYVGLRLGVGVALAN